MSNKLEAADRTKACYVGAPAIFILEQHCRLLNEAFDGQCYLVGSATKRSDWRDVDVRFMMDDDAFMILFPDAGHHWEQDVRWLIMVAALSRYLSEQTQLPIDFQFQPRTLANKRHTGERQALGLIIARELEQ